MENLTPIVHNNNKTLQATGVGRFMINQEVYTTPILCDGDEVVVWEWNGDYDDNFIPSLHPITKNRLELLLIGTGNTSKFPPAQYRVACNAICPCEFMTTASAVRTYCFALAEGRKVGIALQLLS